MRAVVLVGGFGTRLRPLTFTIPKNLLPVAGVPMIERVVGHLAAHGVEEVVLSMGYLPDVFHDAFPDDTCAGVALRYAIEPEPLDTAGAIRFAAAGAGIAERFVVVNGDVLTDADVSALVGFHDERSAEATILLTRVDDPSRFGVVPTDEKGRVVAFVEKPPRDEAPTDLVNAGTYVLEPSALDRIPAGRRASIERETFPAMVAAGTLFALADAAYWIDAGTPATYLRANLDLLAAHGGVQVAGHPVIDGTVEAPSLVGDAAFVAGGAVVAGSVVGAGARVGAGAVVRGSVVLPGALVRDGAVVEDSLVGEGAVVGERALLRGLSVVGGGVEVPAGVTLDGQRLPAAEA